MINNLLAQDFNSIQSAAGVNAPTSVGGLITKILPFIYDAVGILLLIYLILGGLQLMTSRGDPKAVAAAQAKITNALLGFVIVFISLIIVRVVGQIFHINAFSIIFGI